MRGIKQLVRMSPFIVFYGVLIAVGWLWVT